MCIERRELQAIQHGADIAVGTMLIEAGNPRTNAIRDRFEDINQAVLFAVNNGRHFVAIEEDDEHFEGAMEPPRLQRISTMGLYSSNVDGVDVLTQEYHIGPYTIYYVIDIMNDADEDDDEE